ncbi:inositol monophosphatase [Parathielavia appendiculata]|uniref:Inositol-1-monophosphatase n=1 Tax=Parathielavia appendiculata TaxID=2587402 RepID=A0AAN6U0N6_9PEZI|nr:inositol monophosphatase [Parathielavia appendiculata]
MAIKPFTEEELDDIYAFAVQLGKDAGKLLLEAAQARFNGSGQSSQDFSEKDSAVDIVTKTDEDVEAFIKTSIAEKYPDHAFVGEESYSKTCSSRAYLISDTTPTWCVDPLDGTVNYTHLFPMFCVSIALVLHGKPTIGVICAPYLNQLFTACRGRGAWLNETQRLPLVRSPSIPPMPENAPQSCVFSCEWGKDRKDRPDGNLCRKVESFLNMAAEVGGRGGKGGMVHGVRSLGSATMDLAYTAMGAFDIWWEGGCWEWDVAAGIVILQEAGGLITTANPPGDSRTSKIEDVKLGSRLYLAIR